MRVGTRQSHGIRHMAGKLYERLPIGGQRTAEREIHSSEQSPCKKAGDARSVVHKTLLRCYFQKGLAGRGQGDRETFHSIHLCSS